MLVLRQILRPSFRGRVARESTYERAGSRTARHTPTAIAAPNSGATTYTYIFRTFPDISAGATDRAGFIDAPQIGPANIASSATVPPIAIPAMTPAPSTPSPRTG